MVEIIILSKVNYTASYNANLKAHIRRSRTSYCKKKGTEK